MALANFEPGYTPPASIQRMMAQTALLPTRWAQVGDGVLTSDGVWVVEEPAPKSESWEGYLQAGKTDEGRQCFANQSVNFGDGHLVSLQEALPLITEVRPWGWSPAVVHRLHNIGIPEKLLPSAEQLVEIRRLSSRQRAVEMLSVLVPTNPGFLVGESCYCTAEAEVDAALERWPRAILKAPWSGSGKGLRYAQGGREDTLSGWCRRIIAQQGGVVVEPLYDKTADFAMEFWSEGTGRVEYRGLSVFTTHTNGAYAGNRLWSEEQKMQWLLEQLCSGSLSAILSLQRELETCLSSLVGTAYRGPLGVDMMVVRTASLDGTSRRSIHPCVEINLRMTMGYVALS